MSDSQKDKSGNKADFGSALAEQRKANSYSIEHISEQLKISVQAITAIENNDVKALPAATFTQGYIRAYAKLLEISDKAILEAYNQAVPHEQTSELKPRSALTDEASSQSPLVKAVTVFLIAVILMAVVFGIVNYYQEKADVMETEQDAKKPRFTGNSLDSPSGQHLNIEQNARLTDDGDLIVNTSSVDDLSDLDSNDVDVAEVNSKPDVAVAIVAPKQKKVEAPAERVIDSAIIGNDVLKIYAKQGAWVSVRDASNKRLHYNTVPEEGSKVLRGLAPFRISLGNADSVSLQVNDLAVDLSAYVRSNNTATFTVSTDEQSVVFH